MGDVEHQPVLERGGVDGARIEAVDRRIGRVGERYVVGAPAYAFFGDLFEPLSPDRREERHGHQHAALFDHVRDAGIRADIDGRMTAVVDEGEPDLRSLRSSGDDSESTR